MTMLVGNSENTSIVTHALQQIGPVCRWLADLSPDVYVNSSQLGKLIDRSKRSIERMWRRGELPPPVKFAGRNVWFVGAILEHFQKRQAQKVKAICGRRAE